METNSELKTILEKELEKVKDTLLSIECGIIKEGDLPLALNFYIAKKQRIEDLLWAIEVENRALSLTLGGPENVKA